MDFLATLPVWAIYALVGAVLGGIGPVLAWPFRTTFPKLMRILPFVGLVLTKPVTENLVLPHLEDAIVTHVMNADLPKKLDNLTTLTHASLGKRRYVYDYEISDEAPELDAAMIKAANLSGLCTQWGHLFKDGSVISAEYRYSLRGAPFSYIVTGADCP